MLLTALIYSGSAQYDNRTELRVAFITSFEGEYDSSIAAPAVRLAANNVNENESILPGYRLVVELVDDRTTARRYANSKVCVSKHTYEAAWLRSVTVSRVID